MIHNEIMYVNKVIFACIIEKLKVSLEDTRKRYNFDMRNYLNTEIHQKFLIIIVSHNIW